MVREVELAPGRFTLDEGPFRYWDRTIATRADGGTEETIRYRSAAPHWGWLVDLATRRPVRRGLPDGSSPVWCPTDRLTPRDAQVLGLCATLSVVAGFLGSLITQTMTRIADDFGESLCDQTGSLAIIRIGAVVTLVAAAAADRIGRRGMLLGSLVGSAIASTLTAIAPSFAAVTVLQLVSRGLTAAAAVLISIVVVEEIPAHSRAYAIGLMLLPGGLGVGMVLWVLPLADLAPWAWRIIFGLSALAGLAAWASARRLPESERFEHDEHAPHERERQHIDLRRFALLGLILFLLNLFTAPVQQLQNDYLNQVRGFSATKTSVFLLLTNTWGFVGIAIGSQLADRRGRRWAAAIGLLGIAAGNAVMFNTSGWPMWAASVVGSVVGAVLAPALGAMLPELFPTLRRGAANGWLTCVAVVGSAAGLLTTGAAAGCSAMPSYGSAMNLLALAPVVAVGLAFFLPESAGVELEALNPDDPEPDDRPYTSTT